MIIVKLNELNLIKIFKRGYHLQITVLTFKKNKKEKRKFIYLNY